MSQRSEEKNPPVILIEILESFDPMTFGSIDYEETYSDLRFGIKCLQLFVTLVY